MPPDIPPCVESTSPISNIQMPTVGLQHQMGSEPTSTKDTSSLSPMECLPQELLDEITGNIYSWDAPNVSDACRLMECSNTMYLRVRRRLHEIELDDSGWILGWACQRGYLDLVSYVV